MNFWLWSKKKTLQEQKNTTQLYSVINPAELIVTDRMSLGFVKLLRNALHIYTLHIAYFKRWS